MSRGSFIITQKENKGEYGGINCWGVDKCDISYGTSNKWSWNNTSYDWDIYAHVFDQNGKNGDTSNIPIRYANNSTNYLNTDNIPQCTDDYSVTNGRISYTNTAIPNQYSCNPNLSNPGLNAGNWYNFPAATAGSDMHASYTTSQNSICPKGWQLPPNSGDKSYNTLIRTAYGISDTTSDTNLRNNSAMSFVRLGHYHSDYASLGNRGNRGYYWSSTTSSATNSYYLFFQSENINPQGGDNRARGFSVRCVSR